MDKSNRPTAKEKEIFKKFAKDLESEKLIKGELQFTDLTNCIYFLKMYGDEIRYHVTIDRFLQWDGNYWKTCQKKDVEYLCMKFIHKLYYMHRFIDDQAIQEKFEKHLKNCESFRRFQALIGYLKNTQPIIVGDEDLNKDNYLLNINGLTLNLKTGKANPPNPKHLITKKSNFTFVKDAKCPTWDLFLMQIFNKDIPLIHYIQKAMGYSLCGETSEQCMFILWGSGANGKSTFLNTILRLMGDYACNTGIETFMKKNTGQSNDLARLKGTRLVVTSEAEQGQLLSESLIKVVTGEDNITARFLYGEYFSFAPTFKIFMATNHMPKIHGADNGIWRRVKMIPFNVTIPPEQRDKELPQKLLAENSGILNWLLQGYASWKKEGLLEEPPVMKNANEMYRMDMDSVGTFMAECFDYDASNKLRITTKQLYDTYLKWCTKNNERVMTQKWLSMRVFEKGFQRKRTNGQTLWLGLILRDEWRV